MPTLIAALSALLTPLIAVLALYIAWQQGQTNRNKLKLELFERRYAYYEAAATLIGSILGSGRALDAKMTEFLIATKGARFIVGTEIAQYLEGEIYKRATELNMLDAELAGVPPSDERSKIIRRERELKEWFAAQNAELDTRFLSLLQLGH